MAIERCDNFALLRSAAIWAVIEAEPHEGEALIVRYECRDGSQRMWISPIVRTRDGVALGDALEMGEAAEGRFASLF